MYFIAPFRSVIYLYLIVAFLVKCIKINDRELQVIVIHSLYSLQLPRQRTCRLCRWVACFWTTGSLVPSPSLFLGALLFLPNFPQAPPVRL
ncbi:unnamed protein product [Fusarium graminearum]|nr:unnamed protein product [Fusarium graminearum]